MTEDKAIQRSYALTLAFGVAAYVLGHWLAFANLDRLGCPAALGDIRLSLHAGFVKAFVLLGGATAISCLVGIIAAFFGFLAVQFTAPFSPTGGPPPFSIGALFMLTFFGLAFSTTAFLAVSVFGHYLGTGQIASLAEGIVRGNFGFLPFGLPVFAGLLLGVTMTRVVLNVRGVNQQAENWDALESSINAGDPQKVEELLDRGVSAKSKSPNNQSALLGAVMKCRPQIVELLISRGANVNEADNAGTTPLTMAVQKNRKDLLDLLLANGADANGRDGQFGGPLMLAAERGLYDLCNALISKGANVNIGHQMDGRTALHWAARNGHKEVVRLLIGTGADVNVTDQRGKRAYDLAAQAGHLDVIKVLEHEIPK